MISIALFDEQLKSYKETLLVICQYVFSLTIGLMCSSFYYMKSGSLELIWLKYLLVQFIILELVLCRNTIPMWIIFLAYTSLFIIVGSYIILRVLDDPEYVLTLPWSTSFVPVWFSSTFVLEVSLFYTVYKLIGLETERRMFLCR